MDQKRPDLNKNVLINVDAIDEMLKRATIKQHLNDLERMNTAPEILPMWLDADKVIFSEDNKTKQVSTIILWADGTKTMVTCAEDDDYSKEAGIAYCYVKKIAGNTSTGLKRLLSQGE